MHARPSRTILTGLAGLALAGALAACGGGSKSPAAPAAASYAPGQAVTASDVTAMMTKAFSATTTAHATLTMSIPSAGTMSGAGDISMKPTAEDLTMTIMGQKVEVRLVDGTLYMNMGATGGGWMKLPLSALSALGLGSASSGITDPLGMVSQMAQAVDTATYVGTDATGAHYTLKLDAKKALQDALPSGTPTGAPVTVPSALTEDVWFDGSGHLVEAKVDMGTSGTVDVKMSDFGKTVDVKTPAGAKDMSDMLGQLSSSLGGS